MRRFRRKQEQQQSSLIAGLWGKFSATKKSHSRLDYTASATTSGSSLFSCSSFPIYEIKMGDIFTITVTIVSKLAVGKVLTSVYYSVISVLFNSRHSKQCATQKIHSVLYQSLDCFIPFNLCYGVRRRHSIYLLAILPSFCAIRSAIGWPTGRLHCWHSQHLCSRFSPLFNEIFEIKLTWAVSIELYIE